jgi:hypothetical protein
LISLVTRSAFSCLCEGRLITWLILVNQTYSGLLIMEAACIRKYMEY